MKQKRPFVGYHPIQIKRAEYQYKKGKFIKDETVKLPLFYLDDENNPLTLSQVFSGSRWSQADLFGGITRESSLSSVGRGSIDQMVAHFSELDLSQWEFQYEKGNFTIPFPTKVKGDDTFTVLCLNSMT